jgi:NADH:ubiquinone oxidoreductase subunit 5 (subunit L)/multisubunit Na+/H+ antiporter MnhA subunit
MFLSTILLPFLSFLICSLFGRNIGKVGSSVLSVCFMGVVVVFSLILFYMVNINNNIYFIDLGM